MRFRIFFNRLKEESELLPRVILHNAISVDGRIDWFSADIELFYELVSGWKEDATLAGSETLLKAYEDSAEPVEPESVEVIPEKDESKPLLIVPDSKGRIRNWYQLKRELYWRDAIAFVSNSTPQEYLDYLKNEEVEYITAGDEHVDFRSALEQLNEKYGVELIRVDSGGTLNGVLLREGLVDEVSVLIHPALVGGLKPQSMFRAPDLTSAGGVIPLKMINIQKAKNDIIWLMYEVVKEQETEPETETEAEKEK
jgi:2,5-diamino-6-(ribosylamino)-4(3H)-pyrimidinone 5'-phosphate reductase